MKISYNWLKAYLDTSYSPEEISVLLTDCGLEVEAIEKFESVKGGLAGFVIGEVLTKEKHPDADRLSLTTVNIGGDAPLNIVCGAPNVAAGQKVVVATVGTTIYSDKGEFVINKSKIRGYVSEGMICAEDELGLGTSHNGIMVLEPSVQVGTKAKDYFNVYSDIVFEIGLTPNRIDAASHYGVARDLAAVINCRNNTEIQASLPSVDDFKIGSNDSSVKVTVEDNIACPRYSGITIKNVTVADSPEWLKNKLLAIGLRPINNIVDCTNYVLQELAQPLHAFDADKITGGKVIVKKLQAGTKFITLDEVERILNAEDLMICSSSEPMCIAGVFGGIKSGVSADTKNIFLESACFDSVHIRKTSKNHGLKTDASFRFERGTDPDITIYALKRAALLITEIAGGVITGDIVDIYPNKIDDYKVSIAYCNVDRLIGKKIPATTIKNILKSLEINILEENSEKLLLSVPKYRTDVRREADVIEEILRIYGYNNIELPETIKISLGSSQFPDKEKLQNTIADYLSSNSFNEILNNSLTNVDYYSRFKMFPDSEHVPILNPLSNELGIMRRSLLFGGLESISYNNNRKSFNIKFFEFGKIYKRSTLAGSDCILPGFSEKLQLALWVSGSVLPESWESGKGKPVDFFYLKSFVLNILSRLGVARLNVQMNNLNDEIFSEGMNIIINNEEIGRYGKVQDVVLKNFDVKQDVFYAELDWDKLINLTKDIKLTYQEISRFPKVRRDIALLIDKSIQYSEIEKIIKETGNKIVTEVNLFDIYQGDKIDAGKKSYAISVILQDSEKTLSDKEIDATMKKITEALKSKINAVQR